MSILSQIIAYAPNKIDTEKKAQALAIGPRAMVGEITDEQTQFGRPIYQTPSGEKVSEKSTTLFFNGNWMNVPSIHGGKSFNEDELRLMIKQGNLQPTSVHKSKADAEAAAIARSDSMAHGLRTGLYDGGRAGFDNGGSPRKIYKVIREITDVDRIQAANKGNPIPKDAKFKIQLPGSKMQGGKGGSSTTQMVYGKTKTELNEALKKSEKLTKNYVKPKLPKNDPTSPLYEPPVEKADKFLVKKSSGKIKENINEVVYEEVIGSKNQPNTFKPTGKIVKKYKPFIGQDKITIPGQGADTLKEAEKFVADYFKKNPIVQAATKKLNKQLKDLFDDSRIKKILKTGTPSADDIKIVKDILGGTDRQAQEKLAQLADAVDPKGQRTIDGISKIDGKKAKNIFNFHKTKDIAKELEDIAIGKSVGEKPLDFFRRNIQSEIPMKGGLEGYSVDEAKARASSVRLNSKPYSIWGQVIAGDINQGPKQTFDANLSVFEEQVKNAIKNNEDPTEAIKKYNKRATEAENLVNQYKSRNTKKVYFPKITTDSPDIAIKNKSAYTKYKKFFDKNYTQQGYSFVIPKDLPTLPSLAEDLKNKNSSTYKNMIKQIKDVGRKFIKNIDQYDEKELFKKLQNNPNFNKIRRLMPRLASLDNEFTGPGGYPLTAGLDSSIGVKKEDKTFAEKNPLTTQTGLTGAGTAGGLKATGTPIKEALGRFSKGAFGPLGLLALNTGLGVDPTSSMDRAALGLEAALLKDSVKGTIGATKGMKNRALQKGIQRILNAGMSVPTALKVARYASPLGIASLAGEAIYNVGKLGYEDQQRFNALSPEEQAAERAEQEKFAFDIEGS